MRETPAERREGHRVHSITPQQPDDSVRQPGIHAKRVSREAVGIESATGQNQSPEAVRTGTGEAQRQVASQRLSDENDVGDLAFLEQLNDRVDRRVEAKRLGCESPVPWKVGRDRVADLTQPFPDVRPHLSVDYGPV